MPDGVVCVRKKGNIVGGGRAQTECDGYFIIVIITSNANCERVCPRSGMMCSCVEQV